MTRMLATEIITYENKQINQTDVSCSASLRLIFSRHWKDCRALLGMKTIKKNLNFFISNNFYMIRTTLTVGGG
jgi:hypothetical protein